MPVDSGRPRGRLRSSSAVAGSARRCGRHPTNATPEPHFASLWFIKILRGCAIGETPCYFAGTSAAAPHAAAIAALALQSAPCLLSSSSVNAPATARANLRNFITSTTVALSGTSQVLPDNIEGFGLVDALAAVTATLPTPHVGTNQTVSGTSTSGAMVTLNGSGTDPDGCSLTFSWSGASGTASGASATLTCPMGVNMETLTVSNGGATASLPTTSVQITVTDFSVSALPNAATISAGQSPQFNLSLGTQFGPYNGAITLICSNSHLSLLKTRYRLSRLNLYGESDSLLEICSQSFSRYSLHFAKDSTREQHSMRRSSHFAISSWSFSGQAARASYA